MLFADAIAVAILFHEVNEERLVYGCDGMNSVAGGTDGVLKSCLTVCTPGEQTARIPA